VALTLNTIPSKWVRSEDADRFKLSAAPFFVQAESFAEFDRTPHAVLTLRNAVHCTVTVELDVRQLLSSTSSGILFAGSTHATT
jgi:hypothetical protein